MQNWFCIFDIYDGEHISKDLQLVLGDFVRGEKLCLKLIMEYSMSLLIVNLRFYERNKKSPHHKSKYLFEAF